MTPTTYGRDFAYCLKSHGGVRGFNASLWRFLLRCTLFCHSVATFLTSVSSYEGGCGFEDGNDVRNIEDPFARIFVALCKMVHETSYCYYDYPFYLKSMKLLNNDECKCRKSIGKIIDSVQSYADEWPENLNSNSSLLLRLIKNENKDSISTMLTTQLGIKEFTVYLYYELMVEEILNLMYDDGE